MTNCYIFLSGEIAIALFETTLGVLDSHKFHCSRGDNIL
jgi:hypothetical protein